MASPVVDAPRWGSPFRRAAGSSVLFLTSIASLDGTVFVLAASGQLASLTGALVTGLTVVAGVGSWLAARDEFSARRLTREDALALALMGALVVAATVAAALLGARAAETLTLRVLPRAAGVILGLLALEMAGLRAPRIANVPPTLVVLAAAAALEGVLAWTS